MAQKRLPYPNPKLRTMAPTRPPPTHGRRIDAVPLQPHRHGDGYSWRCRVVGNHPSGRPQIEPRPVHRRHCGGIRASLRARDGIVIGQGGRRAREARSPARPATIHCSGGDGTQQQQRRPGGKRRHLLRSQHAIASVLNAASGSASAAPAVLVLGEDDLLSPFVARETDVMTRLTPPLDTTHVTNRPRGGAGVDSGWRDEGSTDQISPAQVGGATAGDSHAVK